MSFFSVTIEEIDKVIPHSNADRLEIGYLKGIDFQFVVPKGIYKANAKVLYFPLDAEIPPEILKRIGLEGKLAGKNKNRVKTIKLRGELSQGIVTDLSLIDYDTNLTSEQITSKLGVTKYEPPEIFVKTGVNLLPLPIGLTAYDIEGADRYPDVITKLMEQSVWISEKCEGSNFSITYSKLDNKIYVNQRNYTIEVTKDGSHSFWDTATELGLIKYVKYLFDGYLDNVTIYGEFVGPGVQNNIYNLKKHTIYLFDIKIGNRYLNPKDLLASVDSFYGINASSNLIVPNLGFNVTLKDWLGGKTIKETSNGISKLYNTLREGIVIKPMEEQYSEELKGRLVIKQRSPEYLAQEK